jgi:type II secretory pathway component GspD/PulD (secretin)
MKMFHFIDSQKFIWILFLTIILLQPCCSGCRKKAEDVLPTEPQKETVVESTKSEPPMPELPKTEPSKPEPPKAEPLKPEPLKPEPSKPEPPKPVDISKPQPVKVEPPTDTLKKPENEKSEISEVKSSTVNDNDSTIHTESPVNTKLPVNTKSPVNTEPPVKQVEPIKPIKTPQAAELMFWNRMFVLGFTAIFTNTEEQGISTTQQLTPTEFEGTCEPLSVAPAEPFFPEQNVPVESPQPPQLLSETKESENKEPEKTDNDNENKIDKVDKVDKKLRFNFKYAPWKDVIEWFADQAGLSLQADNVPQGSLNLTDNQYYTPIEALDILNSYLLFKEYTIIRKGNTMFIIYLPDGIPPNLLEPITPNELEERGKYEICRCVFSLNRTTPDIIQAEAEKLLGPQGSLVVLPKSQQIVITETAGTLRTIRDIIKRIDDPDALSSGIIHIIEMQNLSADEALGIMRKLLAIEETDTSLRTAVDISGTKIWMSGRGDMIERAKEIIKTIDGSFVSKNILLEGQPQFEVYDAGTADPVAVLAVLQTLLAGTPDVRLSLDTKTGGIAALGRPANHATIRETIKQMQLNVPQIEVIPLKRLSPLSAVDSIRKFFATSTVSEITSASSSAKTTPAVPAPTVEADVSARQIIVRGTVSQIKEIRALLQKLGEDGTGGKIVNTSTIRNIPLSPAATALVLDQLKEIWPKLEQNEIRVVTPSAIVPMRSTNELKSKEEKVDELIDETFDKELPTTLIGKKPFYLPVQQTKVTETESQHQPVYQPIRTLEISETEELKRQINELQKKLETLQQIPTAPVTDSIPATNSKLPSAPVVVSSGPNGLMISSEDPEALNKLEELIRMLSDESVLGKTSLVVYYLKNSTAEVVAQTLQTLMGSGSVSTLGVSGTGSVDTSPSFEGEQRAEVLGLLTLGNSIEKTGLVSISADTRLNALLIQANPVDHKTIERLLPILDQADIQGGDILNRPKPRLIPLKNMRAEDAQTVVEKVYVNRLQGGTGNTATSATSGGNRTTNRRSSGGDQASTPMMTGMMPPMMPGMPPGMMQGMPGGPGAMIQQLMRMGGNQGGSSTAKEPEPTMTLGVDSRSNSLIVSAPESLFLQVEAFVKELDEIAVQTEMIVEVVPLKISSDLARQTIGNVYGDSVKFSTSRSSTSTTSVNNFSGFGSGNSRFGNNSTGFGGFNRTGNTGFGNTGFGGNNPFLNIMRGNNPGGFGSNNFGGFGGNNPSGFGIRPGGQGR